MGLLCGKRCQQRKEAKVEARKEVKIARITARADKTNARQSARTDRATVRAESRSERTSAREATKATAYENGIDPNASKYEFLGTLAKTAGSTASSLFGKGAGFTADETGASGYDNRDRGGNPTPGDNKNMMWVAAGIVGFLFVMMNKK